MIFYDLNLLEKEISNLKNNWKKIIWTNWCFDIVHPWHIETFKECKKYWDILVVWLNWNWSPYWKTKPWRPINDEDFRAKMLDSFKYIDYVFVFDDKTPIVPVWVLKPDIVAKWWDYIQESIKDLVEERDGIFDLTNAYKFIIDSWNDSFLQEKWFMPEWKINVLNWWKVIIIPTVRWYSTTNIVEKILKTYNI